MKKNSFIKGRINSVRYAILGVYKLITTEHSIMVQFFVAILITIFGFLLGITKEEWIFQTFAIGLVLSVEGLNTAVEKIADFVHPDFHTKIGFIKDISAGAVTFAVVSAIFIALMIYVPYLIKLI